MLALTESVTEAINKLAEEVPTMPGVRIATEPRRHGLFVSPGDAAAGADQTIGA